jgi:hypothetical protein
MENASVPTHIDLPKLLTYPVNGVVLSKLSGATDRFAVHLSPGWLIPGPGLIETKCVVVRHVALLSKALEAESQKGLEAAKAALSGLRASVDRAMKRYGELGTAASVRSALRELEKEKLGTFKLGPSQAFKAVVKALEDADRTILAKRTATVSRRKAKSKR